VKGYEYITGRYEDEEEVNALYFTTLENTLFLESYEVGMLVTVKSTIVYLHDR
jgi:hypothetical protein